MSYEETMAFGASQYADVLGELGAQGLKGEFTQTGGMNAALVVGLEAGYYLLITDGEDSLSWNRNDHAGWFVGMYRDTEDGGTEPLRWAQDEDSSTSALLALVDEVMSPRLDRER